MKEGLVIHGKTCSSIYRKSVMFDANLRISGLAIQKSTYPV